MLIYLKYKKGPIHLLAGDQELQLAGIILSGSPRLCGHKPLTQRNSRSRLPPTPRTGSMTTTH